MISVAGQLIEQSNDHSIIMSISNRSSPRLSLSHAAFRTHTHIAVPPAERCLRLSATSSSRSVRFRHGRSPNLSTAPISHAQVSIAVSDTCSNSTPARRSVVVANCAPGCCHRRRPNARDAARTLSRRASGERQWPRVDAEGAAAKIIACSELTF